MFKDYEYAVIDVETTGFSPAKHDRIIEIGIVRIDSSNNTILEYNTLINPNRDVGPSYIHGITAKDVLDAPCFQEVVGDVLSAIKGAVLVAHNASFDLRFLTHECSSCGAPLPSVLSLCTLSLSRSLGLNVPSRKLPALCDYFGIEHLNSHSALEDARATAALLAALVGRIKGSQAKIALEEIGAKGVHADSAEWPDIRPSNKQYRRTDAMTRQKQERGKLNRLLTRLPAQNSTNNSVDQYLELLERALEDRHISEEEIEALYEVACSLDMDRDEVREAHRIFMNDLIHTAWEDEIITEVERRDIDVVAGLLGVPLSEYQVLIDQVKVQKEPRESSQLESKTDIVGKQICVPGALNYILDGQRVTREQMEEVAASYGMIVKKSVTKSLNILVCADPNSMSGKAKKARDYGVRIIAEPAFFKMIAK